MGSDKFGQPYREVWRRLEELNMTVWDLMLEVERRTGKFIDYGKLHSRLNSGKKLGYWIYRAVYEALGLRVKELGGQHGRRDTS